MDDEELDNLFRKAAEQYSQRYADKDDQSGKAALWEKLAEELNTPVHAGSSGRRKWGYLILLLFVAAGIFTWLLYSRPDKVEQSGQVAAVQKVASDSSVLTKPISPQNEMNGKDSTAKIMKQGNVIIRQDKKRVPDFSGHSTLQKQHAQTAMILIPSNALSEDGAGDDHNDHTDANKSRNQTELFISVGKWQKLPVPDAELPGIDITSIPDHVLSPLKTQEETEKKDSVETGRSKSLKRSSPVSHWQFGLTVGPDLSSVAGKGWRTGIGGGLKLSYRLNQKWALSTGILFDKKFYDAKPSDYNPPDDNWRNYDVRFIDANCTVIDVPLNVEYTLWHHTAYRIFVGGGLSSFWMKEENYTYHYKTATGEWDQWSKEVYNKNHHLFSVINLSPGYERSWQHLSVQIAPYIKIPVGGIGYGKVKLYSTGVHFTLQYGSK